MKPTDRTALHRTLAIGALLLAASAPAQEAVMSAPATTVTAPVLRDSGPPSQSSPAEPAGAFFTFGSVSLHPHLLVRELYGMGMPAEGGRHVASMIHTLAPGLRVDAGSHWTLDYTPTWTSYSARALKDTVGHSANLQGAGKLEEWAVQWTERYDASSPILVETGAQTAQRTWASQLGASRGFGSGLVFSTSASLDERYGENAPDTRDWSTMNWLTLQFSPRLATGLGFGAGYSDIVAQPDATNERYMGRFNWSPTDKLMLSIDGGVEARHSRASAAKDMNNPILNASVIYRPFDTTKISFGRSRTVSNSYYQKQVTIGSNWNLALEQRLMGHLFLSLDYSRRATEYESVDVEVPILVPDDPAAEPAPGTAIVSIPGRSDRTNTLSSRLTMQLLKRWTVAATYNRSNNRSSQAGFNFITTQFGIEVACRF